MYKPKTIFTSIALSAITGEMGIKTDASAGDYFENGILANLDEPRGCFVSLHKKDGTLRGCIGTIEPHAKNLEHEICRNAKSAAFEDCRFDPLEPYELNDLEISVDVLTKPEKINDLSDLDPRIFGVIVSDDKCHRGVLLPSIPTIDTVEKQIAIVKKKAGLSEVKNENLSFYRFTTTRYH